MQKVNVLLLLLLLLYAVLCTAIPKDGATSTKVDERRNGNARISVLRCLSTSFVESTIEHPQWFRNGELIEESPPRVVIDGKNGSITFKPPLPEDEGQVRCNEGREYDFAGKRNIIADA